MPMGNTSIANQQILRLQISERLNWQNLRMPGPSLRLLHQYDTGLLLSYLS